MQNDTSVTFLSSSVWQIEDLEMVTWLTINNLLKTSVKYLNLMEIPISVLLQKHHTISFLKNFSGLTMLLCLLQGEKKNLCGGQRLQMLSCYLFKNGVEFLRFFLSFQYHTCIAKYLAEYCTKCLILSITFSLVIQIIWRNS